MKNVLLASTIALIIGTPAIATDYLIFLRNEDGTLQTRPSELRQSKTVPEAKDMPDGAKAIVWIPGEDKDPQNYYRQNSDTVIYFPEPKEVPPPGPHTPAFLDALVTSNAPIEAFQYVSLLMSVGHDAQKRMALWSHISKGMGAETVSAIEAAAESARMPLK